MFNLDADARAALREGFDDLLAAAAKPCKVVYPPRWVNCDNCVYDPLKQLSSNRWKTGGPMPFQAGHCPLCSGKGRRAEEVSETLSLTCSWEPRDWARLVPRLAEVRVPYGLLLTRGMLADLPKVQRCDHLVVQLPIAGLVTANYKLAGEAGDAFQFVQGRYFVAPWERAG